MGSKRLCDLTLKLIQTRQAGSFSTVQFVAKGSKDEGFKGYFVYCCEVGKSV